MSWGIQPSKKMGRGMSQNKGGNGGKERAERERWGAEVTRREGTRFATEGERTGVSSANGVGSVTVVRGWRRGTGIIGISE
jgi:hypothetical protein